MLDKRGNSNSDERIELIKKYILWFGRETINCILADREFVGEKWLEFLNDYRIGYHIRIRNNFMVYSYQKQKQIPAFWFFNNLKIGQFKHYHKIFRLNRQDCCLSGYKTIDREGKQEFLIIVSFNKPEQAMIYYKKDGNCVAITKTKN